MALLAFFSVTAVATLQCYPGSSCDSFYYCVTIPCNHFKAVLVIPCGLLVDTTHQSLNSLKITTEEVLVIYLFTNNEGWQTCMASIKSECFAVNLHLSILKILINTQNTFSICKIVLVLCLLGHLTLDLVDKYPKMFHLLKKLAFAEVYSLGY